MVTARRPETIEERRARWREQRRRYYQRAGEIAPNRGTRITGEGLKAAWGCIGRWPIPCHEAWPVSRFAWCEACR